MKWRLSVLLITLITITGFAQMPMGGAPNGMKAPEGKLFGKVVDEQGKPVEFASVVLLKTTVDNATNQSKDVLVKAQSSELNGDFHFSEVPVMAKLKLKISSVGYKTVEIPIAFDRPKMEEGMTPPKPGQQPDPAMMAKMMAAFDKDLGNIKIESDTKVLNDVTVTATKALLEMDIDKKTFNVEKNIVTAGGTAVDVMRNI